MGTKLEAQQAWFVKAKETGSEAPAWITWGEIDWELPDGKTVELAKGSWAETLTVHAHEHTTTVVASKALQPGIETTGTVVFQEGMDGLVYSLQSDGASVVVKPLGPHTGLTATNIPDFAHPEKTKKPVSKTEQPNHGVTQVKTPDQLKPGQKLLFHTLDARFKDGKLVSLEPIVEQITVEEVESTTTDMKELWYTFTNAKGQEKMGNIVLCKVGILPYAGGTWEHTAWLEDPSLKGPGEEKVVVVTERGSNVNLLDENF